MAFCEETIQRERDMVTAAALERIFVSVGGRQMPGNNKHSHSRVTFCADSFTPLGLALSALPAAGHPKTECFSVRCVDKKK